MPELVAQGASGPAVLYRFDGPHITIGRDPAADLVIRDPSVSRRHAEIREHGGRFQLRDLGSTNGTSLNGRGVDGSEWLAAGDEIRIATTRLVFDGAVAGAVAEGSAPHTVRLPWTSRGQPTASSRRLIGSSPYMVEVRRLIRQVADAAASVLVTGESGTGKEIVAWCLHHESRCARQPFVTINAAALPPSLLEAELFGIAAGVATGVEPRPGCFESANGGTLFLDEIGDMSPEAQTRLLRVLQDKAVQRLGSQTRVTLDVRIVAATNQDLEQAMAAGRFRRDLFHRLNVVPIALAPLRSRPGDIAELIDHLLAQPPGFEGAIDPRARERLLAHDWPGNVRELEHLLERARLLATTRTVTLADLPPALQGASPASAPIGTGTRANERPPLVAAADPTPAVDQLCAALSAGHTTFWDLVHGPFLRRELPADTVRKLITRLRAECGGSYKQLARRLGIAHEYKRLMNFLNHHRLGGDP